MKRITLSLLAAHCIKPARVIECEPVEQTFCVEQEEAQQAQAESAQVLIARIRAMADDMEVDAVMTAPGTEVDFSKYAERLMALAKEVRKLNGVTT